MMNTVVKTKAFYLSHFSITSTDTTAEQLMNVISRGALAL